MVTTSFVGGRVTAFDSNGKGAVLCGIAMASTKCCWNIGSTAVSVVGMDPEAGQALLADLLARATTPDHVYRHHWSAGDLVVWDNRATMHRVAIDYPVGEKRIMQRVLFEGEPPV